MQQYKELSDYADIANAIDPSVEEGSFDVNLGGSVNEPIEAGLDDFKTAANKMDFRSNMSVGGLVKESDLELFNQISDGIETTEDEVRGDLNETELDEDVLKMMESPELQRGNEESISDWVERTSQN